MKGAVAANRDDEHRDETLAASFSSGSVAIERGAKSRSLRRLALPGALTPVAYGASPATPTISQETKGVAHS